MIGAAVKVMRVATGEDEDEREATASAAAQQGKLGGTACARNLPLEQRVEITEKVAATRRGTLG